MRIDALTSIRGFAAWLVVVYHFRELLPQGSGIQRFFSYGYLAVDLFFILSGFVIALNYAGEFTEISLGSIKTFLVRRAARIYPLHLTILLFYLSLPLAIVMFSESGLPLTGYDPGYFLLSLTLTQNWGFTDDLDWNVPAWSISTELAAYLCFPFVIWALRRQLRTSGQIFMVIAIILTVIALYFYRCGLNLGDDIPRTGLTRCLLEFLIGSMLWMLWSIRNETRASDGIAALLLGMGALVAFGIFRVPDYLLVPFGFTGLIYGLAASGGKLAKILSNRILVFIGQISFSTYLVHFLMKTWIKLLFVGAGAPFNLDAQPILTLAIYLLSIVVASIILYQVIERPGQHFMVRLLLPARTRRDAWTARRGGPV